MDPDLIAYHAAKNVAAHFTAAVQRSTHTVADISVARSTEFQACGASNSAP